VTAVPSGYEGNEVFLVKPTRTFPADHPRSVAGQPFYQLIERQHRAAVWQAVWHTVRPEADTIVMVSDVDEIPDPKLVADLDAQFWGEGDGPFVLQQRMHSDRLSLLHPYQPWLGTTVSRWHNCDPHRARQTRGEMYEGGRSIPSGGWHLSWFGTDEQRAWKVNAFSHGEVRDKYDPAVGRQLGLHPNGEVLKQIDTSDYDWPQPILDGSFEIPEEWL
jgi:hypothetical protein